MEGKTTINYHPSIFEVGCIFVLHPFSGQGYSAAGFAISTKLIKKQHFLLQN
jgi:hypothetical protein